MAKDKPDPLPNLDLGKCPSRQRYGHEPLMNASYLSDDSAMPVTHTGAFEYTFDGGILELRVCKFCGLLYAQPKKWDESNA